MKAYINEQLISQTVIDSGNLAMLGAVIHNFPEPGEYHGTVLRGKQLAATFRLTVDEKCEAMQANIDMAALTELSANKASISCECKDDKENKMEHPPHFIVNPRGYTLFFVSKGIAGYAVQVNRVNERLIIFDSRELQEGDLFSVTLIRPGSYSVINVPISFKAEINVMYPKPDKKVFRPQDPVTIEATDKGMILFAGNKETKLDKFEFEVSQGQIYRIKTPSRIKIELLKPDDGPKDKLPASVFTWSKQKGPKSAATGPRDHQIGTTKSKKIREKVQRKKKS